MKSKTCFGASDLKAIDSDFVTLGNSTLVPMVDSIYRSWTSGLLQSGVVTDIMEKEDVRHGGIKSYICVVGGRFTFIRPSVVDIDCVDDDGDWYMASMIGIEGELDALSTLTGSLAEHVRSEGMDRIKADAASRLRKGKTYHLCRDVMDFYLKS